MSLSTAVANSIYNALMRQTNWTAPTVLYLSLHTADPGATGASECTDGTYARFLATTAFGAPTAGVGSNTAAIEYAALTTGATITHYGLWSASTAGTFYHGYPLSASKAIGAGEIPRFAAGALTITAA